MLIITHTKATWGVSQITLELWHICSMVWARRSTESEISVRMAHTLRPSGLSSYLSHSFHYAVFELGHRVLLIVAASNMQFMRQDYLV